MRKWKHKNADIFFWKTKKGKGRNSTTATGRHKLVGEILE